MSAAINILKHWKKINARQHCKRHMLLLISSYLILLLLSFILFGSIITYQDWNTNNELALKKTVSQVDNLTMLWQDDLQTLELFFSKASQAYLSNQSGQFTANTLVFSLNAAGDQPKILFSNGNLDDQKLIASKIAALIPVNNGSSDPVTSNFQEMQYIFRYGKPEGSTTEKTTLVVARPMNQALVKQIRSNSNLISFWTEDVDHQIISGLDNPSIDPSVIRINYRRSSPRAIDSDSNISYSQIDNHIVLFRNFPHLSSSIYLVFNNNIFNYQNNFFWPVLIMAAVLIITAYLIFNHFRKNVYLPITQIEKAVNGIIEEDMREVIQIDENNEFKPLADNINNMTARIREILNREYNSKILRKQAEINALQSQINPHFLYNTLDSIRGQALSQGSFEVANLLKSLSNLFRYSINQASSIVTLAEELRHIDHYLTIQQYRFNNKFSIIKNSSDLDELGKCQIPKLTIQPIVENAIFHGLEKKPGKGTIEIRAHATEKRLIIEIEDDGVGMDEQTLRKLNLQFAQSNEQIQRNDLDSKHNSIALVNVNQRIRLLYGSRYGIKIFSTLYEGTVVQIVLPLIIKDETTVTRRSHEKNSPLTP